MSAVSAPCPVAFVEDRIEYVDPVLCAVSSAPVGEVLDTVAVAGSGA